jgi:hypothetical protein
LNSAPADRQVQNRTCRVENGAPAVAVMFETMKQGLAVQLWAVPVDADPWRRRYCQKFLLGISRAFQ